MKKKFKIIDKKYPINQQPSMPKKKSSKRVSYRPPLFVSHNRVLSTYGSARTSTYNNTNFCSERTTTIYSNNPYVSPRRVKLPSYALKPTIPQSKIVIENGIILIL